MLRAHAVPTACRFPKGRLKQASASPSLPQFLFFRWQSHDRVSEEVSEGVSEGQGTNWIHRLCPSVTSLLVLDTQLGCGTQGDVSIRGLETGPHGIRAPLSLERGKSS